MYKMAPVSHAQTAMVSRYVEARRMRFDNGFQARDLCMVYRTRGRLLIKTLPGLGLECRWLGRNTSEDEGPYA